MSVQLQRETLLLCDAVVSLATIMAESDKPAYQFASILQLVADKAEKVQSLAVTS
jgi:hypothetical protein